LLLLLLAVNGLSCSRAADQSASTVPMADSAAQDAAFSAPPWLRERLPPGTIAYFRLPSPWRTLLGPAGKTTDRMFRRAGLYPF